MKRLKFVYTLMLCGFLFACAEDLGNYDYHDLIEPEISGIDAELSVLTYKRLKLEPDLGRTEFTEDRYSFEWKVIAKDGSGETTVIGNTRNLDYEVVLPEGSYKLYFTVTEKASGVYWQKSYDLQVSQTTSEGWMVLCTDEGRARLDMVSAVTGETIHDILQNNGMPQFNGPRRIQQLSVGVSDAGSPFYLLTDEGATRLGKNGFDWKEEYRLKYEMATGIAPFPHEIMEIPYAKVMVSGTELYYADCGGISGLFGSPVNKTFPVAPRLGVNVSTKMIAASIILMYDTANKRLMGYVPALADELFGSIATLWEMNDLANIADDLAKAGTIKTGVRGNAFERFPQGLEYVYMENTKYDPGNGKMGVTYLVLADGGHRYVYGIQLGDMLTYGDCSAALGKAYYGEVSSCTGIAGVSDLFAFSSLKNYMYYAVGGTVYRVDLSAQPLKAEKQFTLSGETITCLKFNHFSGSKHQGRSYDLIVGSVKGNEGVLRVYDGSDLEGDFSGITPQTYTGFARIVDVTYREPVN